MFVRYALSANQNHRRTDHFLHLLTPHERMQIQTCLELGLKQADIARRQGRHPSIISREIKRNGGSLGRYKAASAQQRYQARRRATGRKEKLDNEQLRTHVETQLRQDFSPEQIAGRLPILYPQEQHMRISQESASKLARWKAAASCRTPDRKLNLTGHGLT